MKELECRDVEFDCGFVARGRSDCEVLDIEAMHARKAHGVDPEAGRCGEWRTAIREVSEGQLWTMG